MNIQRLLVVVAVCCTWGSGTMAKAQVHPLSNPKNSANPPKHTKAWQIEYENGKAKDGNLAIRLVIGDGQASTGSSNSVGFTTAKLYRFTKVDDETTPTKYEIENPDNGGVVSLQGTAKAATKIGGGNSHWSKAALDFILTGTYLDTSNNLHVVTVRGTYHPGKKNRANSAHRSDDTITIRIQDKPLASANAKQAVQELSSLLDQKSSRADILKWVQQWFANPQAPCDEAPPADAAVEEDLGYMGVPNNTDPAMFPYETLAM